MSALHAAMVAAGVSALTLCASVACGADDHELSAEAAALEWTAHESERISEEIAAEMTRMRGRAVPVTVQVFDSPSSGGAVQSYEQTLRSTAEIRDTVVWAFGAPARKLDGRYAIVATASVSFEIAPTTTGEFLRDAPGHAFPTTFHRGSVDYELEIDTAARDVTGATMLLESVRIADLPREGAGGA